jgi:hypothetical protein
LPFVELHETGLAQLGAAQRGAQEQSFGHGDDCRLVIGHELPRFDQSLPDARVLARKLKSCDNCRDLLVVVTCVRIGTKDELTGDWGK